MMSWTTLGQAALGIAFVGASGLYAIRWSIQSKIRESGTYQQALRCLRENTQAVEFLGEPIKDKSVEIGDNNCYGRKDNVTWVTVPLQGRRRTGSLHYWITIADEKKQECKLSKVELSIDGTSVGRILLKEDSGDS